MLEEKPKNTETVPILNDVAKEIIRSSIRSAVCIDDEYLAPYSDTNEGLIEDEPKKLFYSFRKDGNCDLDIYRFKSLDSWRVDDYTIHNKDLMILDWELDLVGNKYESTLAILDEVIDSKRIPFVVIYTHTGDINLVSKTLFRRYNQYSSEDYTQLVEKLKEKFKNLSDNADNLEHFLEDHENDFYEFIRFYENREKLSNEIISNLNKSLGIDSDSKDKTYKKIVSALESKDLQDAILKMASILLSNERLNTTNQYKNIRIEIERHCYGINGIIVLIIKKDGTDGVNPEDLFEVFSEAISSNPHSIINIISLELKDKLREDFAVIGTKFNDTNEQAFLYHANNYQLIDKKNKSFDKPSFQNFVIQSWMNELTQYNLDLELKSFDLLEGQLSNKLEVNPDLEASLIQYASMVSCVKVEIRKNKKLAFGDVFKADNAYFLCITPHCDCLRPNKIKHEFYFVTGEKTSIKSALQNAEEGYYSFLKEGNEYVAVEWKCKPFTTFISSEKNNIDQITCSYSGQEYQLKHLVILKENYTQRIANNSFGYGYRVGIDIPYLAKE